MKKFMFRFFNLFLVLSFFWFIAIAGFLIYSYGNQETLNLDLIKEKKDSYVYDNQKKLIGIISRKEKNQEDVTYNELNQSIINSLVGTEDSKFFSHYGFDVVSTLEKTFDSVVKKDNSAGGSSITQQLVGDVYLDRNEKTYKRKLNEIIYSIQFEQRQNKTNILTNYLNHFFYGKNNIYGINNAAKYYFNKNPNSLDYIQSAILSGTLNAPSVYNPLGNGENNYSNQRLDNVLLVNHNKGYLSDAEYYLLQQVKVESSVNFNKNDLKSNPYGSYIDRVKQELENDYNINFDKQSLHIYTAMDKSLQNYTNKIIKQQESSLKLPDKDMDFGFVVENNTNGEIKAIGGGKSYKNNAHNIFNNGYDLKKQPGSAFKPIIDYLPAIEFAGFNSNTTISNAPYNYPGTNIAIRNHDGSYGGYLNIAQALAQSSNLSAVRTLEYVVNKIGFAGLNDYLTRMGFNFTNEELAYAYALGGTNTGVSPLEMAQAYATIANNGKFIQGHTVKYFTIDNKEVVKSKFKAEQVVKKQSANLMNKLLKDSVQQSYLFNAVDYPKVYAAKTGTTNWGKEGSQYGIPNLSPKDSWIAGSYKNDTIAIWTGFDINGIKKGKYPQWGAQHDYAAKIFGKLLQKVS